MDDAHIVHLATNLMTLFFVTAFIVFLGLNYHFQIKGDDSDITQLPEKTLLALVITRPSSTILRKST